MNRRSMVFFTSFILVLIFPITTIRGCTIFTVSNEHYTFFGNNEDYLDFKTYMMVRPATSSDEFGNIFFGFDNFFPQGGINSEGLAFDANALIPRPINDHSELLTPSEWIPLIAMKKCSNISQVINLITQYNWYNLHSEMHYQVHFADAYGDAIIVSPGLNGELAITRKADDETYLISTNFNVDDEDSSYCWRYKTALSILEDLSRNELLNGDDLMDTLAAVHQEGPLINTLYSNIFDLKNKMIYLCYYSQFNQIVKINVTEKLVNELAENILLKSLFSSQTVSNAQKQTQLYTNKQVIAKVFSIVVLVADFVGLLILIALVYKKIDKLKQGGL